MNRLLIAAALAAVSAPAAAQSQAPSRSTPFAVSEVEIVGEVVKVNKGAKTVVVKDPAGRKVKLQVPPGVTGLEDIKPGQMLDLRYINAVAVQVAKPGAARFATDENIRLAPQGGQPAEIIGRTKRMSGTVTDFDRSRRELSVKGPEGYNMTLQLPEDFMDWDKIKVGDTLAVQYTEAVALRAAKKDDASGARDFERDTPMTPADRTDTDTRRPGADPFQGDPSQSPPNQQPSDTPNRPR